MPRQARLDVPGALHHIMIRGINKAAIFEHDEDKMRFLERLGQIVIEGECTIYAWVLMSNHVHILFKSGKHDISTVMRRLLTWYAQYYNHRYNRSGHLFENRYKSILCDEENYLLALVRYIHLNPIRAAIVKSMKELEDYPWSGHQTIIGKTACDWMDRDRVLAEFGEIRRKAVDEYRRFVQEGMRGGRNPALTGGGLVRSLGGWSQVMALRGHGDKEEADERILGSGDFVQGVIREVEERQLRQTRLRKRGKGIQEIIREESERRRVNGDEVMKGSRRRQVSQARVEIAVRCKEELGLSGAEIARHLEVNTTSINRALEKRRKP
jgi:putative transposase